MATVVDTLRLRIEASTSAFDKSMQKIKGQLLGAGLSFLFTGMAIKRLFQTALQSLFSTFLLIEGETSVVANKVNNLKAGFFNLKHSIVSAFDDTGALDKWVARIDKIIKFFTGLDDETKVFFVEFAIGAVIAGAALMVLGQTMLGVLGVMAFISLIGVPVFLGLVFLALLLALAFLTLNSDMDPVLKSFIILGLMLLGIAALLFLVFGVPVSLIAILLIALIGLAAWLVTFKEAAIGGLLFLGEVIIDALIQPFTKVVQLINLMIRGWNRLRSLTGKDAVSELPVFSAMKSGLFTQTQFSKDLFAKHKAKERSLLFGGSNINFGDTLSGAFGSLSEKLTPDLIPPGLRNRTDAGITKGDFQQFMDVLREQQESNIEKNIEIILDGEKVGGLTMERIKQSEFFSNGSTTQFNN